MHPHPAATRNFIVAKVARLLFWENRAAQLAAHFDRKKGSTKCWINGTRRPPVEALKGLREMLIQRQADCGDALRELDDMIAKREHEPRRLTGAAARWKAWEPR
jgi:hypothetical protein